jgi:hypothetical protein
MKRQSRRAAPTTKSADCARLAEVARELLEQTANESHSNLVCSLRAEMRILLDRIAATGGSR